MCKGFLPALFLLLTSFAAGSEPAEQAESEFTVTNYQLAFVDVAPAGEITNEYVPSGESLENWSTLIGVRVWPAAGEVKEIAGPYVRALQNVMVEEAKAYEPPDSESGTDVIFELYLAPADHSYLEYNLIRFTLEDGTDGVKSYQFAIKGAYDLTGAHEANGKLLESRLEMMADLEVDAVTDKDDADHANDDEPGDVSSSSDEE